MFWVRSTHLILIFCLDEQRQRKAHLGQFCDEDPVLWAVEVWGVVVHVYQEDGEGGPHGCIRRTAIIFQLRGLRVHKRRKQKRCRDVSWFWKCAAERRSSCWRCLQSFNETKRGRPHPGHLEFPTSLSFNAEHELKERQVCFSSASYWRALALLFRCLSAFHLKTP